jgi:hypothetical protein
LFYQDFLQRDGQLWKQFDHRRLGSRGRIPVCATRRARRVGASESNPARLPAASRSTIDESARPSATRKHPSCAQTYSTEG